MNHIAHYLQIPSLWASQSTSDLRAEGDKEWHSLAIRREAIFTQKHRLRHLVSRLL